MDEGFCGGNNLGIRAGKGRFVALVNNDTVPDREWLARLVDEAETSPDIAAVGSKILFLRPFLPVTLSADTFNPAKEGISPDGRDLGVIFDQTSGFEGNDYAKQIFKDGFFGPERLDGRVVRWTGATATVFLPVRSRENAAVLHLVVSGGGGGLQRFCSVRVGPERLGELELASDFQSHRYHLPLELVKAQSFDVINNAGSRLSQSGVAGDRGIYEPDRGQFDEAEDIEAVCGASVLFRRTALDKVGVFDPDFFMYYEDTDLSWRLRASGYRLRYQPKSVVRHIHAASSEAWSPMFSFYVARNRALMIAKNGSFRDFLSAYVAEVGTTLRLLRARLRLRGAEADEIARQLETRVQVQRSFVSQIPKAFLKRWGVLTS